MWKSLLQEHYLNAINTRENWLKKYLKLQSNYIKEKKQGKDQNIVRWGGVTGKFVAALFLQSRFRNLPTYTINWMYTQGVMLLELNLLTLVAIWLDT